MTSPHTLQSEQPSRFPLPLDEVRTYLDTFGGFTQDQLMYAAGSNAAFADQTTPYGHMWDFKEDLYLHELARYCRPPYHRYKDGRPDYSPIANMPAYAMYRAGAALGQVIMNGREQTLAAQGVDLPPITLDPRRVYLHSPENASGNAFEEYWSETARCDIQDKYLRIAREQGYFDSSEAGAAMELMGEAWKDNRLGFLFPEGYTDNRDFARFATGFLFRSLFQLFRLHRIGEHEEQVASTGEPYDPAKHQRTGTSFPGYDPFRYQRHWYSGIQTDDRLTPEVVAALKGSDRARLAKFGKQIVGVSRHMEGFAPLEGSKDLVPVVFKGSREYVELTPDDALIVARGDKHRALRWPFIARTRGLAAIALCRDGVVEPLTSVMPEGHALKDYFRVANQVLTDRKELDESFAQQCFSCSLSDACSKDAARQESA